ncbi:MAG: bifunctional chorismate mutase/prephenate dehydrogenase [Gammaproteobacteria bacterium]|nr:bifunctional chorismate mutase/prephenate dehydrogenase [Gammaproteobacteria bacterium]
MPTRFPKTIVILGGAGRMGRRFGAWLAGLGHTVHALDQDNAREAPALLARAHCALLALPIDQTEALIGQYAPLLPDTALLADLTSLKRRPLAAMLAAHPGPVLGLHPMFGPSLAEAAGQRIVVCAGRDAHASAWLLEDLQALGAQLVHAEAEEHDRMMAVVQAVRHFVTLALGSFLAEEGIDIARSLDFASPVYRLEIDMVSRLFAQDAGLYADILLADPERQALIGRLAEHYTGLAALVGQGDRTGLCRRLAATGGYFAGEADRAMAESDALIAVLAARMAGENPRQP